MENFVPYELAIKLKEKGFILNYNFYGYRPIYSNVNTIKLVWDIGTYEEEYFGENIPCPTISQALKWLREKDIMVFPVYSTNTSRWYCSIVNADSLDTYKLSLSDSYEEAALAGIEHVLDNNLI